MRVAVGFSLIGGGWCVAPCSVGSMRKKSDMTDGFGPWTRHVLKMYRREVQDDCLIVFTVGLIFVPLLVLSVFMPFWAAKIWVEGIGGEFAFNAAVALLIALVVSVPATVILGVVFIRRVKLVLRFRRVRDGVRGFVGEGRPVAALKYGVKHWTHGALRGPSSEGARTVGEFLDGLDYVDERELVGKI